MLAPLPFLAFRRTGNISSAPAMVVMLLALEVVPDGSPVSGWAIVMLGVVVACLPMISRGLIVALSHIAAMALWPTVVLAASDASASTDMPFPMGLMLDMAVWIVLFGMMLFAPLLWRRYEQQQQ